MATRNGDPVRAEYERRATRYDQRWAVYIDRTTRATLERLRPNTTERTHRLASVARLLTATGFIDVRAERYRIDWWWGLMTLQARKPR